MLRLVCFALLRASFALFLVFCSAIRGTVTLTYSRILFFVKPKDFSENEFVREGGHFFISGGDLPKVMGGELAMWRKL